MKRLFCLGAGFLMILILNVVPMAHADSLIALSSSQPGNLYSIDTTTGNATLLVGLQGGVGASFTGLSSLEGTLYATDIFSPTFSLASIDPTTGAVAIINNQGGSANWHGLASNESAGLLYSIDLDNNNTLVSITSGGVITPIGSGTGIQGRGMAYDDVNGILYATGPSSGIQSLYTVDTTTGIATLIGSTGIDSYSIGLEFVEATNALYMLADPDGFSNLYSLDIGTGAATLIGSTGVNQLDGLSTFPTQPIPEPTSLLLLGTGLGVIGYCLKRRDK